MPPRPDNAARTHRPRGPSGAARGCEASSYPENRRVFRIILVHYLLSVDGKREPHYGKRFLSVHKWIIKKNKSDLWQRQYCTNRALSRELASFGVQSPLKREDHNLG